ncbi:MAG TPA: thiamine pyrophosphate-dependent dehydrogenase E1 component subunit alpha, partial [Pseudomonadota bacterium]|nr:thiamine pyrophosphate-dependent dehydrogenase E1 component subunit alpha [Pseudomonadota bacterium]
MRNAPPSFGFAPPAEQFVPRQYLAPNGSFDPTQVAALGIPRDQLLKLYRGMLLIRIIDERMLLLQRQGRISFYGEARGQEAAVVGTAAGLGPQDYILPALREAGAALYRGLPLRTYISQIYGNENDVTKGRQMPCHPGTRQARYVTMSSCIATQLPHAVGMAMAAKIRRDDVVIAGYMGDGATSEGDFHVALNFAAVYKAPVVFVCQNNQWAISTPVAG